MLKNWIHEFSSHIFSTYYETDYLENVTSDDWKVEFLHETSVMFGFNPETLGNDAFSDERENVLFNLVWNKYDSMLYINMERYRSHDQELFPSIYSDLLSFLEKKGIDCLVSVFCYDHYSDINDMNKDIPLSTTGEKSENILNMLTQFPSYIDGVPVLQISFDGIQFNDWNSKFYKLAVDMEQGAISISSYDGVVLSTISEEDDSAKFVKEFVF